MNTSIKNILGGTVAVAVVVLALAGWRYASFYGASIEPSSFRSFAVSAEGKTVTVPDVAQLTFSVVTEGTTDVGTLQVKNTEKMNGVIEFVKSKGVDKKDIKTQTYQIEPRYQYFNCNPSILEFGSVTPCPPAEIVGYTIRQSVLVKVRDFGTIGAILSGAVKAGANSVSGPSFTIDDPDAAKQEARKEAVEKAKEKAAQIAKVGGFSVGRLLSIEEGFSGPIYPMYERAMGIGGAGLDAKTPVPSIEPGSEEVTVTVTLRYEIE